MTTRADTDKLAQQCFAKCHTMLNKAIADWLAHKYSNEEFRFACSNIGDWLIEHVGQGT